MPKDTGDYNYKTAIPVIKEYIQEQYVDNVGSGNADLDSNHGDNNVCIKCCCGSCVSSLCCLLSSY